jgi:hypothetical protein
MAQHATFLDNGIVINGINASMSSMTTRTRSEGFALRWTAEESAEIRRRADEAGMAVGPYLIAAALGTVTTPTMGDRVAELERRLTSLERVVGFGPGT